MPDLKGEAFHAATGTLRVNTAALTAPSALSPTTTPPANSSKNSVFPVLEAGGAEFGMVITNAAGETVNWGLWLWNQVVLPETATQPVTKNDVLWIPRRLCYGVATAGSLAMPSPFPSSSLLADTWAITEDVTLLPGVQTVAQPGTPNNGFATIVVPIDFRNAFLVMETDLDTAAGALPIMRRLNRLPG